MKNLIAFLQDESGTTIPEYAVISGLISMAALGAMAALELKFLALYIS